MNFEATVAVHAPTFNCPNCNHEIKLTESLAAPLIEENRKRFQELLASKDAEVAKKTEALRILDHFALLVGKGFGAPRRDLCRLLKRIDVLPMHFD